MMGEHLFNCRIPAGPSVIGSFLFRFEGYSMAFFIAALAASISLVAKE